MIPHALTKAESLLRLVQHLGCGPKDFVIAITPGEAYELLDYLLDTNGRNALLLNDVNEAKLNGNPWPVLAHFELMGFPLCPVSELH